MQWVWENLSFKDTPFQVAHFEAPSEEREEVDEDLTENLGRCEVELGACLWHETNATTLRYLENPKWYGGSPGCFSGRRVLELGAGAGLCGIALALDGADSTVSDLEGLLPLLQLNVTHNGFCPSTGSRLTRAANEGGSDDEKKATGTSKGASGSKGRAKKGKRRGRRGGDDSDEDFGGPGQGEEGDGDSPSAAAEPSEKKLSAKERRSAREAARKAKKEQKSGGGAGAGGGPSPSPDGDEEDEVTPPQGTVEPLPSGSCRAVAVDWLQEAKSPTLPPDHFDLIIVCDCLYENKASWSSLRAVIDRSLFSTGQVLLASAAQRRPFLRAFIQECDEAGLLLRLNSEEQPPDGSESPEVALLKRA